MVTPITGVDVVIKYTELTSTSMTNEQMSVVNDEFPGVTNYTVYRITNSLKRYLDDSVVPTFQKSLNGTDWTTIPSSDIEEIQYPGGRLVLKSPLNADYYVRCSSGKYFSTLTDIIYAKAIKVSWKNDTSDVTVFTNNARVKYPVLDDWSATIDTFVAMDELGDFPQLDNLKALRGQKVVVVFYLDESNDFKLEGYGYLEGADINMSPGDVIQQPISIVGSGKLYMRLV